MRLSGFRSVACVGLLLACALAIRGQKTAYDFAFFVLLEGQVCDGRYPGDHCFSVEEVLVSLGDPYLWKTIPVDYTNWMGEFVVNDRVSYGYTRDEETGEIVSGTSEFRPYLSFTKSGFREVKVDLRAISSGDWIESASPIYVTLQPADSVEDGTAGFHPSMPIPVLPVRED